MPENASRIELGDEVRDEVTGFNGIVIAVTTWLNGCRRMVVQPRQLGDKGQMPATESIDELQLVLVNKNVVRAGNTPKPASTERKTGGPRPDAQAWPSPAR